MVNLVVDAREVIGNIRCNSGIKFGIRLQTAMSFMQRSHNITVVWVLILVGLVFYA
jgi:hypothetical protein